VVIARTEGQDRSILTYPLLHQPLVQLLPVLIGQAIDAIQPLGEALDDLRPQLPRVVGVRPKDDLINEVAPEPGEGDRRRPSIGSGQQALQVIDRPPLPAVESPAGSFFSR
jgi:hypothetical protein